MRAIAKTNNTSHPNGYTNKPEKKAYSVTTNKLNIINKNGSKNCCLTIANMAFTRPNMFRWQAAVLQDNLTCPSPTRESHLYIELRAEPLFLRPHDW